VWGTKVKGRLFPADEKDIYFHIYYNDRKYTAEKEHLNDKIDSLADFLKDREGTTGYECPKAISHYFEPIYHTQDEENTFMLAMERQDVIKNEIDLCGYFIIITSEKMTAEEDTKNFWYDRTEHQRTGNRH